MSDLQELIRTAMRSQGEHRDDEQPSHSSGQKRSHRIQIFVIFCFLSLIVWASFAELEIATSVRGELIQLNDVEKIQHLEGGMLEEMLVKEGDRVFAGQVIGRLRAIERDSQHQAMITETLTLQLEIERLSALFEDREPDFKQFSAPSELVNAQRNDWWQESAKNQSTDDIMRLDIEHKTQLIASMKTRTKSARSQLQLIQEQLEIKESLYKDEVASYIDVLNMRVQKMNMLREIENLDEAILNENFLIQKLDKQLRDGRLTRNAEYLAELNSNRQSLSVKEQHLKASSDKVARLEVVSPVDGVVDKVHFNYQSAVVPPGESIADISPLRSNLIAEAKVPLKDVGFIEIGQIARIKLDTYTFTQYGSVAGEVISVSRNSFQEKDNKFYLAKIALETDYVERNGARYHLGPNMEFTADIKTGSRTVLDYAVKPIVAAIEDAFDER
jgi:HlyD family secretion protein/adhesin transport system membrane fusion protein